jgi:thiamine pyrophosphokinase
MEALLLLDGEDFLDLPDSSMAGGGPSTTRLAQLARNTDLVLCTDGSAREAVLRAVVPHVIIGDMDSLTQTEQEKMVSLGAEIITEADQDSNDFEKALRYLLARKIDRLVIVGISGGNIDHILTNFSVLAKYADRFRDIRLVQSATSGIILTSQKGLLSFVPSQPTIYSLIPLPTADGIITEGLKYELANGSLAFGSRDGLSNISVSNYVSVSIESGTLLVMEHKVTS